MTETSAPMDAEPSFPPLLTGHAVAPTVDPFAHGMAGAREHQLGAGDLVWSKARQRVRVALVLEPEVARATSLQMLALLMVAAGDCLGALMPPQVPVHYRWPDRLLLNSGDAGGFRVALAACAEDAVPDWLVIGCDIALGPVDAEREPGATADITSIVEEGGGDLTATRIIQSLAGHLMTWLNIWQDDGFRPVHDAFFGRLEGHEAVTVFRHAGRSIRGTALGLDENGGLIVKTEAGRAETLSLADALDLDAGQPR